MCSFRTKVRRKKQGRARTGLGQGGGGGLGHFFLRFFFSIFTRGLEFPSFKRVEFRLAVEVREVCNACFFRGDGGWMGGSKAQRLPKAPYIKRVILFLFHH